MDLSRGSGFGTLIPYSYSQLANNRTSLPIHAHRSSGAAPGARLRIGSPGLAICTWTGSSGSGVVAESGPVMTSSELPNHPTTYASHPLATTTKRRRPTCASRRTIHLIQKARGVPESRSVKSARSADLISTGAGSLARISGVFPLGYCSQIGPYVGIEPI